MPIDSLNDRVEYITERIRTRIMGVVRDTLYEMDANDHETMAVQHRFHWGDDIVTDKITEGVEIHQQFLFYGGVPSTENQ